MHVLFFILLLLALICFVASASAKVASRVNLLSLGAALWVAVPLIQATQKL